MINRDQGLLALPVSQVACLLVGAYDLGFLIVVGVAFRYRFSSGDRSAYDGVNFANNMRHNLSDTNKLIRDRRTIALKSILQEEHRREVVEEVLRNGTANSRDDSAEV